jgi:rubrerythrin
MVDLKEVNEELERFAQALRAALHGQERTRTSVDQMREWFERAEQALEDYRLERSGFPAMTCRNCDRTWYSTNPPPYNTWRCPYCSGTNP